MDEETMPDTNTLFLTLSGPITDPGVAQLIQMLESVVTQEGIEHIYLILNTPGGSVNAGITLYHYLRSLPIKVSTHNVGQVDSIGNVIFLSGEDRFASSATSFLLHGVSLQLQANGLVDIQKSRLEEALSQITQDEQRIEAITSERTSLTRKKLSGFFRSGKSLGPKEAQAVGIVTKITELKIPHNAKRAVVNTFPAINPVSSPNAALGPQL